MAVPADTQTDLARYAADFDLATVLETRDGSHAQRWLLEVLQAAADLGCSTHPAHAIHRVAQRPLARRNPPPIERGIMAALRQSRQCRANDRVSRRRDHDPDAARRRSQTCATAVAVTGRFSTLLSTRSARRSTETPGWRASTRRNCTAPAESPVQTTDPPSDDMRQPVKISRQRSTLRGSQDETRTKVIDVNGTRRKDPGRHRASLTRGQTAAPPRRASSAHRRDACDFKRTMTSQRS